jgi:dihydropteroate synthase
MQILQINHPGEIKQTMLNIGVDPYGIKIMLPKAVTYLVRMNSISNIAANILKQEMLSLGGDVAVSRGALTGKAKKTDCLLMGNLSQLIRLKYKLNKQPFGLAKIADDLSGTLKNFKRDKFTLSLGKYKLNLGSRAHVMGIVNLTPDSFSGDGLIDNSKLKTKNSKILDFVERIVQDGADIIDLGGESSRPGAKPVSAKEELNRIMPAIKTIRKKFNIPVSVDTYKLQVAKQALDNGANLINDISGLRDKRMIGLIAKYKAGVVIMHMKGTPSVMQKNIKYDSLIDEITQYLGAAINRAEEAGIDKEKIIIDPGIGFAKTVAHNLEILNRLQEFKALGKPILVGPSRKSFIGKILNTGPGERISGTVSACVLAVKNGAKLVRVHDVKEVKQALKVFDAISKP